MSLYLGNNLISGVAYPVEPSRNIGQIIQSTIPLTDAGLHLLDGSLINGSGIYNAFVDYIASIYDASANYFCTEAQWQTAVTTYGVCGKFVYDSVNNTVRLPKVTGFIEGASGVANLGDLTEAGLPNITGRINRFVTDNSSLSGCFEDAEGSKWLAWNGGGNYGDYTATLNASLSSSIYGNSNTVQPQSIKVLYYIVIATTTKTEIEVDIDEIATDLNGKADVDLTNATPTSNFATALNTVGIKTVVETYVNGASWYRVYSDGWCEQGGYAGNGISSVSFLKVFANTDYTLTCSINQNVNAAPYWNDFGYDRTTTGFKLRVGLCSWQASGYIS